MYFKVKISKILVSQFFFPPLNFDLSRVDCNRNVTSNIQNKNPIIRRVEHEFMLSARDCVR